MPIMEFISPNQQELAAFLKDVDMLFHTPLSTRRDLDELAEKIRTHGHCLLACDGEKAIGGICWYDNDSNTCQSYINVLAVLPQYQGRGMARLLLEKSITMLPPYITSIKLWTQNPIALRLYLKSGFIFENRDDDVSSCIARGGYLVKLRKTQITDTTRNSATAQEQIKSMPNHRLDAKRS